MRTDIVQAHKHDYKLTELGEIPEEWEVVRLGSEGVLEIAKAGGTPLRTIKNYWENGNIPFVKIEDITSSGKYLEGTKSRITESGLQNSSAWIVPVDSLLLAMYASFGEATINKIPVATNQAIIALRPNKASLDLGFLYHILVFLKKMWKRYVRETTQKNLNAEVVKQFSIPLPPLLEQKKIASILSTVDDSVQATDSVIAATERLKKGLMQVLLTKGIGHTKFKKTEIGEVPEEWEVVRLGDLLLDVTYGTSIASNNEGRGFPVLGTPNILGGEINERNLKYVELREPEINKVTLIDGDILLVRTNANPENMGRCALFEGKQGNWVFASYLIRIRPRKDKVAPELLVKYLQAEHARRAFLRLARTSAGNYNINTKEIKSIPVCLPPLPEQRRIAEILSAVDRKIQTERQRKEKLERLKKGLMQVLLTGKVRAKV